MLEKLKMTTLIRELEFLKSDLNYKTELLTITDNDFHKYLNLFLENYPDLGKVYKELVKDEYSEINGEIIESKISEINQKKDSYEVEIEVKIEQKGKNLYRQIGRLRHPDKVGNTELKNLFIEAQKAYENGNTIELMTICDKLKIPYEISENEIEMVRNEIDFLKERISFLEGSFTFKWLSTPEGKDRDKLILNYIGKKLNI